MSIADLTAAIERGYEIGPDGDSALNACGEPFVTFAVEATMHDTAIDHALAALLVTMIGQRFGGRAGEYPMLYWRKRPEFTTVESGENQMRRLRCRIFIGTRCAAGADARGHVWDGKTCVIEYAELPTCSRCGLDPSDDGANYLCVPITQSKEPTP